MAIKQFAVPLDENSKQPGDITFVALADAGVAAKFQLTYVTTGGADQLNLKTKKNGTVTNHTFAATVTSGTASVDLTSAQLVTVYNDAKNGDWDYVEAYWTVGTINTGGTSNMNEIQSDRTYDGNGWPPLT